mgnify:FL=1
MPAARTVGWDTPFCAYQQDGELASCVSAGTVANICDINALKRKPRSRPSINKRPHELLERLASADLKRLTLGSERFVGPAVQIKRDPATLELGPFLERSLYSLSRGLSLVHTLEYMRSHV